MPNIYNARIDDLDQVEDALIALEPAVLQTRNQQEIGAPMTEDGGLMYSFRAKALAQAHDVHLWINTLDSYSDPATAERSGGFRGGGRGDELAVLANMPHEVYGFQAEQGATVIQTDEPEAAIEWLTTNGYGEPYSESLPRPPPFVSNKAEGSRKAVAVFNGAGSACRDGWFVPGRWYDVGRRASTLRHLRSAVARTGQVSMRHEPPSPASALR